MTMSPKPGNQPDPNDMSDAFASDDAASAHNHPDPAAEDEAEEEADRLGNFA
jgi:hypothetical protein